MNNSSERVEIFDNTVNMVVSLQSAIIEAGGSPHLIIKKYMDLPLRDFLTHVCIPNGVRFYHEKTPPKEEKESSPDVTEMSPKIIKMRRQADYEVEGWWWIKYLSEDGSSIVKNTKEGEWIYLSSNGVLLDTDILLVSMVNRNGIALYKIDGDPY